MAFEITPELLASGHKYRRELLALPMAMLSNVIVHMTPRYGIQGKETVGMGANAAQLRPYRTDKGAKDTSGIELRTIETFLGDVVEEFDPYVLWSTIYSNHFGTNPTQARIAYEMAMLMAKSVGETLRDSIWTAKRNEKGETTMDLFNGFESIIDTEKTAGSIAESKGNLLSLGDLTLANVCDKLKQAYRNTHEQLRRQNTKMFLPQDIYDLYCDGYQIDHESLPYNLQFKKTFLEGSDGRCELVPMTGMSQEKIILTTKRNMLVGMDQTGSREKVEIRRPDNPKLVQFFMVSYFGVEYESIHERNFCAAEFTLPSSSTPPAQGEGSTTEDHNTETE